MLVRGRWVPAAFMFLFSRELEELGRGERRDDRMSIRAATRFQSTAVAYSPWNESSLAVGSAQHFGIVGNRTHAINACVRETVLRCPVCYVR
ncbi:MAG: hypothetical protein ACPIOQ_13620, partial [Promethearchaeia archaeon]